MGRGHVPLTHPPQQLKHTQLAGEGRPPLAYTAVLRLCAASPPTLPAIKSRAAAPARRAAVWQLAPLPPRSAAHVKLLVLVGVE